MKTDGAPHLDIAFPLLRERRPAGIGSLNQLLFDIRWIEAFLSDDLDVIMIGILYLIH